MMMVESGVFSCCRGADSEIVDPVWSRHQHLSWIYYSTFGIFFAGTTASLLLLASSIT